MSARDRLVGAVLVVLLTFVGCGTPPPRRGDAIDEPALRTLVAFVGEPGTSRETVEARLGPPKSTYEGGRIVGYRFAYVVKAKSAVSGRGSPFDPLEYEWQAVPPSSTTSDGPHLMIEYDPTGKVVRHGLIH